MSHFMNRRVRTGRWPAFGLLAILLVYLPATLVRASELDDSKKEIADVEKKIAELQQKLEDLKHPRAPASTGVLPDAVVKKMVWRSIGPANMGGRVTAIAVVESDPTTYYIATASGGLLKTTNNGTTFSHLFDHESAVSIGDVEVAPSDPNIVWVGTGENNPRNSVSYGDGVYKSTDAGKTWKNMGLKQSFQIGKIIIHPKDPNTVYVGALGRLYGPSEERGLFKTEDGGKTWKKILYVDEKTGVIDMRMDPNDPNTLLAALWERKRDGFDGFFGASTEWPTPDQYGPAVTYGPGGGLFKSSDGGKNWKKLTDPKLNTGLPTVKTGRIGIDYSRKTKGLVFAIIDTENIGKGRPVPTVYLGVSFDNEFKGPGVKIEDAYDDGPALKAGFKAGDVVTALDDKKIADYDDFNALIAAKKPEETAKFTVKRGDKEVTIEVKLAPKPAPDKPAPGANTRLLPGFVPVDSPDTPLIVKSVPKGGQAEKAGVKAGMQVVAVEGKAVTNWPQFRAELRTFPKAPDARKAGDKVKLTFKTGDKNFDATLTLELLEFGPQPNPNRRFLRDQTVGGQLENVVKDQGKDGFQTGGVFVSKDGGDTWMRVNSLNPRPFYFSNIRVDPNDDKRLFVLGDKPLWRSTNGGARFEAAPSKAVHDDMHALWIDSKDSRHMLIGCDGGFYVTYDRGDNWDHLNTQALGQFYHVCVDNQKPYHVYGGLQDNGSWGGPSRTLRSDGPVNEDWVFLNGGDGFVCRVDPNDPDVVYAESQNGVMTRRNLRTGETKFIGHPATGNEKLRWNWNTPFILSSHNPSIFYCGAQEVFRSITRGENAREISTELTRTKAGTISALAESPLNAETLWAGTDDGNLWLTRDGGVKWDNLLEKLTAAGLPGPRWVSSIEPSRTVPGRCYITLDAHRSDDDRPYAYVTEDNGQSWKPLMSNLPSFGSTHVLREDYTNPNILYCGTEFGVWVSLNRGAAWAKLNNNLPTVAVREIAQPATAGEIVAATHGRSIWILDVTSLRQMTTHAETVDGSERTIDPLATAVTLFAPAQVVRWKMETGREFPYSHDIRKFYGDNPKPGANFEYLLTRPAKAASLRVLDVNGALVFRSDSAPIEAGFHRLSWNLGVRGTTIPAGGYRVILTVDGKEYSQALLVENDPKADPKAIIAYDQKVPDTEEDEQQEDVKIVPLIPKIRE